MAQVSGRVPLISVFQTFLTVLHGEMCVWVGVRACGRVAHEFHDNRHTVYIHSEVSYSLHDPDYKNAALNPCD